jgi:CheY-like chemotaxis protein
MQNVCLAHAWRHLGQHNLNGRGACFSFHLPIAHVEETTQLPPLVSERHECAGTATERSTTHVSLISEPAASKESSSASWYKVLVVDDILINLKVLERMLKRLDVKKVKTAISARKALEELSLDSYDLVLTDIQMPEMSGIELSDRIHDNRILPTVVGLTADVSESVRDACIESGMAMVLLKPLTFEQVDEFFKLTLPKLLHERQRELERAPAASTLDND